MNQQNTNQNYQSQLQRNGYEIVKPQNLSMDYYDPMLHNKPQYNRYDPNTFKDYGNLSQRVTPDIPVRQLKPQTIYTSANTKLVQQPYYEAAELQKKPIDLQKYDRQKEFMEQKERAQDKIQSLVLKSTIAQKSPEQIINEFKAYTLPKLRLKRLIMLQAAMKGYHVRRFKIPRIKQKIKVCQLYAEDYLRKVLYDKFIPDIVLEVITYNKYNQDLSLYSDKHQAYLKIIDDLLNRVVRRMANEVVKDQTDYLVTSILNQRFKDKPEQEKDPMKLVAFQTIQNFLDKEVYIIAKDAIKESSSNYYIDLQYARVIKDHIIPNTLRTIIFEALDDLAIEKYLNDLCSEMVREISQPLSTQMTQLLQAEHESASLDQALQNYVYRMMGDVLIEHLLLMDNQDLGKDHVPSENSEL
ncbi:unnamed protein product [Paramecium sonneborni]|uniref:Uncharacterized protein n=1 Tax=Paramecium sonneborni TaxID=65129 RepID=A0A8S1L3V3_9CILI|nr:unnamed protein product [Paramecium sonneborni]